MNGRDDTNWDAVAAHYQQAREEEQKRWDQLDTLKHHIVIKPGGELFVASWLALVPAKHLDAITHIVLEKADEYFGRKGDKLNVESLIHDIYGAMSRYLNACDPLWNRG